MYNIPLPARFFFFSISKNGLAYLDLLNKYHGAPLTRQGCITPVQASTSFCIDKGKFSLRIILYWMIFIDLTYMICNFSLFVSIWADYCTLGWLCSVRGSILHAGMMLRVSWGKDMVYFVCCVIEGNGRVSFICWALMLEVQVKNSIVLCHCGQCYAEKWSGGRSNSFPSRSCVEK